ncbi:CLUMA_CG001222, isoform A [Clunio marinus]|uniref:CLUMA_CG001222, isoform A n=1 Tax=Clunio marinus TaxID=568069 RepID=A0A1J1HJ30_9DIPT|nr:CLUMA_CG001222, isoform A [Clunio marinus]
MTFIVAKSFIATTMKLKTFLVTVLILIFVKCSDQAVKFLKSVGLNNPLKIRVNKVEETHNEYMLDFKHSLRITQNFTNYISVNMTLFVKLDSTYLHYSVDLPNSNGKMVPFIKRTGMNMCNFSKALKGNKILQRFFKRNSSNEKRIMESCPVEPGFYFIKDFIVGETLMTYAVAETKIVMVFGIATKINEKMVDLFSLKVQFEIKTLDKLERERKRQKKIES